MDRVMCGARVRRVLLLVGLAFVALPVGSALAATTIGQTGTPIPGARVAARLEVKTEAVIPAAGNVTSFQFQAGGSSGSCESGGGAFDFQVLRFVPGSEAQYQVVGHTGTQHNPCDGMLHSYSLDVPIAVEADDVLGVFVVDEWEGILNESAPFTKSGKPTVQPSVGDTVELTTTSIPGLTLDESATLVRSPLSGSGGNTPNGNGPFTNPSPQVPHGSPQGCGHGRGWKIGTQARC
jgi:hypothetical protein